MLQVEQSSNQRIASSIESMRSSEDPNRTYRADGYLRYSFDAQDIDSKDEQIVICATDEVEQGLIFVKDVPRTTKIRITGDLKRGLPETIFYHRQDGKKKPTEYSVRFEDMSRGQRRFFAEELGRLARSSPAESSEVSTLD